MSPSVKRIILDLLFFTPLQCMLLLVCVIEYLDKVEGILESIAFSVHGELDCPLETAASARHWRPAVRSLQLPPCSFLPPKCYSSLAL